MRQNGGSSRNSLWIWAAGAGLIVFLFIQVFPVAFGPDAGPSRVLSRGEARDAALRIAQDRFGISAGGTEAEITYMTDSMAVGYLSKEDLLQRYGREWADTHPTDVYRADLRLPGGDRVLTLFLHMESGRLLGWRDPNASAEAADSSGGTPERALAYASLWGVNPGEWKREASAAVPAPGRPFTFTARKGGPGQAQVTLSVLVPPDYRPASSAMPPWKGGFVTYDISVPAAFSGYMEKQRNLAGKLNAYGFVVPEVLLLITAVVYAATRREFAVARRGIALSAAFLILYAVFYLNMLPGFRAGLLEKGAAPDRSHLTGLLTVNLVILAGMALFTCLSAVAGDRLWRSMGRPLWPNWQEASFGKAVFDGMRTGYPLAFILLGVQSVILVALENGIGMFQASDATQSAYNMTVPWLLPVLAWCAGISEELQSRLFGIGLFRHWLLGLARRVLGREPSARAASALTVVAMLPPGLFWAFGHVGYAVYPAYSRLIELIVMGLLFGWFLLRFGLIAVIFAHVTLDSALMGVQLAFGGQAGGPAAAVLGIALPAFVAYVIGRVHRRTINKRPAPAG